jgi:hypothetical protein
MKTRHKILDEQGQVRKSRAGLRLLRQRGYVRFRYSSTSFYIRKEKVNDLETWQHNYKAEHPRARSENLALVVSEFTESTTEIESLKEVKERMLREFSDYGELNIRGFKKSAEKILGGLEKGEASEEKDGTVQIGAFNTDVYENGKKELIKLIYEPKQKTLHVYIRNVDYPQQVS